MKHWWTNGIIEKRCEHQPLPSFYRGRKKTREQLEKRKAAGKKSWEHREWTEEDRERLIKQNKQRKSHLALHSQEARKKIARQRLGAHWYYKGDKTIVAVKQPEGFEKGRQGISTQ